MKTENFKSDSVFLYTEITKPFVCIVLVAPSIMWSIYFSPFPPAYEAEKINRLILVSVFGWFAELKEHKQLRNSFT